MSPDPQVLPGDDALLDGWGGTAPTRAHVSTPLNDDDAQRLVRAAPARGVVARGLGRAYGDAAQNAGGLVLDATALSGIIAADLEHGVVTARAGTSLQDLMEWLVPRGWFPITPGTRLITVGGAIASDIHGKNHHRDGGFAAHVTSLELETPAGERLTLTPSGSPDAFRATAGGMGLTGIIVEATVQLIRVETGWMRVDTERARDLDELLDRLDREDDDYRYSVAWVDLLAGGARLGRSVIARGDHASLAEMPAGAARLPAGAPGPRLAAPRRVPATLLNRYSVAAFNELWYRRAPRLERGKAQPLESFFYPLDGVRGWNRLYGPGGFVQYQLVVPLGEEELLRRIVARLHEADAPACLAVLKRLGSGRGLLSFPLTGWTLAVDFPARSPDIGRLLDDADELVAEAGGRVYLAKDARLRPELLEAMYPELPRWREVRAGLDPEHRMWSDLARRLGL
jgi:decaprenylphospho-beta-D-ribofuranose 2-oxidase